MVGRAINSGTPDQWRTKMVYNDILHTCKVKYIQKQVASRNLVLLKMDRLQHALMKAAPWLLLNSNSKFNVLHGHMYCSETLHHSYNLIYIYI